MFSAAVAGRTSLRRARSGASFQAYTPPSTAKLPLEEFPVHIVLTELQAFLDNPVFGILSPFLHSFARPKPDWPPSLVPGCGKASPPSLVGTLISFYRGSLVGFFITAHFEFLRIQSRRDPRTRARLVFLDMQIGKPPPFVCLFDFPFNFLACRASDRDHPGSCCRQISFAIRPPSRNSQVSLTPDLRHKWRCFPDD